MHSLMFRSGQRVVSMVSLGCIAQAGGDVAVPGHHKRRCCRCRWTCYSLMGALSSSRAGIARFVSRHVNRTTVAPTGNPGSLCSPWSYDSTVVTAEVDGSVNIAVICASSGWWVSMFRLASIQTAASDQPCQENSGTSEHPSGGNCVV